MKQYHDLLKTILEEGNYRGDRTGTGTISCFGLHFRHNLQDGFPLLTTKKMNWKAIVIELLWFLKGDTNIKYLLENGVHIWTDDAYRIYKNRHPNMDQAGVLLSKKEFEQAILHEDFFARLHGDLGPIYGKQWRHWKTTPDDDHSTYNNPVWNTKDQIKEVIASIKSNPEGRRHIVTAWNPAELDRMALPPCHCMFQLYVHDGKLSCHMYQRSADVFLGVPFNIASYALLTHIIAYQCNLSVGDLVISFGDIHIYRNHLDQVKEQLTREPRPLPKMELLTFDRPGIEDYLFEDFVLVDYDPHLGIKGDLSVGV